MEMEKMKFLRIKFFSVSKNKYLKFIIFIEKLTMYFVGFLHAIIDGEIFFNEAISIINRKMERDLKKIKIVDFDRSSCNLQDLFPVYRNDLSN